jgi:hypothetical protein
LNLVSKTTEATLIGYKVYRNSEIIAEINNPETTYYNDLGLAENTYNYHVTAIYESPEGESVPSNTVTITITISGVNGNILPDVSLFPNPFQNSITIMNAKIINKVVITNLIGQTVKEFELNGKQTESIATDGIAKGIYLITLYGSKGERKVIKMIRD